MLPKSPRDIDRDLRDEVEFHIEARTRELIDAGWLPDAAAAEARRQFGNRDAIVAECHRIDIRLEKKKRMMRHLSDIHGDILFAVRQFFSQRLYSAVAVITLALGIGSATAIFSIVDAVLLEPLPYSEPDRLFALRSMDSSSSEVLGLVMRRSAIMALGGVLLGLLGTIALGTIVQSHLSEISALDPVVLITIPLVLLVIALFASFLPARRASRIDPVVMLRE